MGTFEVLIVIIVFLLQSCFTDLLEAGVDCVTLGQYMQPTKKHLLVRIGNTSTE